MIQISYISTPSRQLSSEELKELLASCRRYNAAHGVTGMLLYYNSIFLQVLEGDEAEVDALMERISKDPRHADIKMLRRREIEQREFPDWHMAFRRLTGEHFSTIPELSHVAGRGGEDLDALASDDRVLERVVDHFRKEKMREMGQEELSLDDPDPLINGLHRIIRHMVRVVAVLMVFTIFWGVIDVVYVLYTQVLDPAINEFVVRDIIIVFGAFLTVLIAIEIFMNITLYLRDDVIHIRLVIVTALMAIARKVIILDFEKVEPMYMFATAAIVVALGITYWLVGGKTSLERLTRRNAANG